jgi:hypothetical protein
VARTRSIKPEFFTDADLTELSPLHRLLFAGLWCHADREGRLEEKLRELKVKVLPFDQCDLEGMLVDLARIGRIVRYEAGGLRLISIPNFKKHQHCHKDEKPSRLPPPPEVITKPPEPFENGIAIVRVSNEHGASTKEAPREHRANTPVTVTVTGTGDRAPVAPPARAERPTPPQPSFATDTDAKEWLAWHADAHQQAFPGRIYTPPGVGPFWGWYVAARAELKRTGSTDADLRAGYLFFLTDEHWAPKGCPWAAWAKQWGDLVEKARARLPEQEAREVLEGEDPYADEGAAA